jgi:16S rRNA (cytosine1402-N4)-methyltransferase
MFEVYGEVRNARTLAKTIVEQRKSSDIKTIEGFKNAIDSCIKGKPNRYLAQVFQALRIEVNQEMEVLSQFLEQTKDCLKPGGRLAIITFHSLEDRLTKKMMKNGTLSEVTTDAFGRKTMENPFKVLKDVLPSEEELEHNNRSRSARLRIAEYMDK